jgi:hypothetical protein
MGTLNPSDIAQMTTISAQIGQDIADSVTFVESQITTLANELTNIAPIFSPVVIFSDQNISKPIILERNLPDTLASGDFGIDTVTPDEPTGLVADAALDEAALPVDFSPLEQSVVFPEAPDLDESVSLEPIPDAPTFTDPGVLPGIDTFVDVTFPTLPSLPSLLALDVDGIVFPATPTLNLPAFNEALPVFDVDLPDFTFNFTEQPYASGLLDATTAKLLNDVTNGGTGLGAVVEQEIYDRSAERDARNIDLEVTRFKNQASVAGFDLPFGVLTDGVADLISKHDDQQAERNRTIIIEQANLAQNNTQFAIAQSIGLEGTLINYANDVANRALQAARSVSEFAIAFHNAEIAGYNARLQRYTQAAQVHFEQLRTEAVKLDLFRAELAGVDTRIAQEGLRLEEFNSRVARLNSEVSLFNGRVGMMNSVNDINRVKINKFSAEIDGFNAILGQNRNLIDLHNAQLRTNEVEFSRVNAQIGIHNAKLDTVRTNSANRIQELNAQIDHQKNQLAAAQNQISTFSAVSSRVSNREGTLNTLYGNSISKFSSGVEADKAAVALEQDNVRIALERAVKDMDRIIEVTRTNVQKNFKEWDFRTVVAQSVLAAKQFILEAGARSDDQTIQNL